MRELTPKQLTPDAKSFIESEAKGLLITLLPFIKKWLIRLLIKWLNKHNDTRVIGYDDNDLFI